MFFVEFEKVFFYLYVKFYPRYMKFSHSRNSIEEAHGSCFPQGHKISSLENFMHVFGEFRSSFSSNKLLTNSVNFSEFLRKSQIWTFRVVFVNLKSYRKWLKASLFGDRLIGTLRKFSKLLVSFAGILQISLIFHKKFLEFLWSSISYKKFSILWNCPTFESSTSFTKVLQLSRKLHKIFISFEIIFKLFQNFLDFFWKSTFNRICRSSRGFVQDSKNV